jgi:hypothetical protein
MAQEATANGNPGEEQVCMMVLQAHCQSLPCMPAGSSNSADGCAVIHGLRETLLLMVMIMHAAKRARRQGCGILISFVPAVALFSL